jgi:hypothetical protein
MANQVTGTISPPVEHLIAALATDDIRIQASFRQALGRAIRGADRLRREELEALIGLSEGLAQMTEPDSRNALQPALRRLLVRVLRPPELAGRA